jgi:hypothetical protein
MKHAESVIQSDPEKSWAGHRCSSVRACPSKGCSTTSKPASRWLRSPTISRRSAGTRPVAARLLRSAALGCIFLGVSAFAVGFGIQIGVTHE